MVTALRMVTQWSLNSFAPSSLALGALTRVARLGVQVASIILALSFGVYVPAFGQVAPLLMVEQGSHSAPVRRIDVKRGVVVTASDDRTARVWDLDSGALRHVLRPLAFGAEGGRMYGASIHPSLPLVAVGGTTGGDGHAHQIYLFNVETGALDRTIDAKVGDVRRLLWSDDGTVLFAAYSGTNGVRAFALEGGGEVLDERSSGPVFGLAVASSGMAAAVSLDGRLTTWQVSGGKVTGRNQTSLNGRRAAGVSFSPDGARLVVAFADSEVEPELFDSQTLKSMARLPRGTRLIGDLRVVSWSTDGQAIHVGGTAQIVDHGFAVVTYNAKSGTKIIEVSVAADSVTDLVALPSGQMAYSSFDGTWGVLRNERVDKRVGSNVAILRGDAPEDIEASADATTVRWGVKTERGGLGFAFDKRRLTISPTQPLRVPVTSFGLLAQAWNQPLRGPVIWGKEMKLASDERGRALAIVRTPTAAAFVGTNRAIYRLDDSGQVQWRQSVDTEVRGVNTDDGGRWLITAMADGTMRWWRASDGALLLTLLATADGQWVVWTPSGYFDASAGADRLVGWAVRQGPQLPMSFHSLNRFRERFNRPDVIDAVLRTLDEKMALDSLAIQDAVARDETRDEATRQSQAARAASRQAETLAAQTREAQGREAQARIAVEQAARDAQAKSEAARLAELKRAAAQQLTQREAADREATARRDEARLAAANEAATRDREREAAQAAAAFAAERESALRAAAAIQETAKIASQEAALRQAAVDARTALIAQKPTAFPPALSTSNLRRFKQSGEEISLPFRIVATGPAGDVVFEVRVNGRPAQAVDLVAPTQLDGAARGVAKLRVGEGESLVEIIARNQHGVSEPLSFTVERAVTAAAAPRIAGDLYVLAIGISEYARAEYRLNLAAKDATDFARSMKNQEGKLYRRVHVRTLTNRDATRAGIARELEWLRSSVEPTDVAMLFVAGHGLNDATGQYFFVPFDGQHERLASTAVSQFALVSALSRIRGKTLFFVDTCFAGNTLGAMGRQRRQTEKLMNDLSASENGVVVFASSTGQEESLEKDEWRNGAFTKALLDGLAGKADFMRAGRVTFAGLHLFVSEEVRRLTDGRQRPVFISPRGIPDFAVARL